MYVSSSEPELLQQYSRHPLYLTSNIQKMLLARLILITTGTTGLRFPGSTYSAGTEVELDVNLVVEVGPDQWLQTTYH